MKIRLAAFLSLLLSIGFCFAQVKNVPRNIKQAIKLLQIDCPDSLKLLIQKTADDKLTKLVYPGGNYNSYKTIDSWTSDNNEGIKINKYLAKRGITRPLHQEAVILIAFKTTLLGQSVEEKKIFKSYEDLEARWNKEDAVQSTTDTLRGHYIPKDINDCFRKLNLLVPDSDKKAAKSLAEDAFVSRYYMGLGFWVMNNWGLGGGSRLSVYFNSIGIYNNESMAGVVLVSYYRYLNGSPIYLDGQVKKDKEFWAKSKEKRLLDERNKFDTYKIGDTVNYNYNFGYINDKQEEENTSGKCGAKGIITARDTSKFYIKVRILETCDRKGIVIFDSKLSMYYDKKKKKWLHFKRRIIKTAHNNDELWFRYQSWNCDG